MQKFWRWLAVELGKKAGLVTAITLLATLALGYGATRLKFATSQDSYLEASSQIAKDNVEYQKLFGGQAMVTLVTLNDSIPEDQLADEQAKLLVGENADKFNKLVDKIRALPNVKLVVNPVEVIQLSADIAIGPGDGSNRTILDAASSLGGRATLDALERSQKAAQDETDPAKKAELEASAALRQKDLEANQGRLTTMFSAKPSADNPNAGKPVAQNPDFAEFLINGNDNLIRPAVASFFPDTKHIQLITRLEGNLSLADEDAAAKGVVAAASDLKFDNASVVTTGAPILIGEINDYLRGGLLTLGAIAIVAMIIILVLLFDVRWRLLPLVVVIIGVTWAFGLAGYFGIPLNLVTIAGLPVMLGVGIDYAIQMHSRVEEEVIIDREAHPIQETARHLGPALLVVTLDAVFAFSALLWAKTPMIKQFGVLLAVGIAAICFSSIVNPLAWLGIREYRRPTKGKNFSEGKLGRMVVKLGSLSPKLAIPFAISSVLIFFAGLAVEGKLTIQTDPERWVNQSSQNLKDLEHLSDETGSSSELGVFVRSTDPFSAETIDFVHHLTREVNAKYGPDTKYHGIIAGGNSFLSVMADTIVVPGAADLPPLPEHVKESYDLAPDSIRGILVADNSLNIIFRTGPSNLQERSQVVNQIREEVNPPEGITATPSGLAVVGVGLLENLESGRILLSYLSIIFVFAFLALRLNSNPPFSPLRLILGLLGATAMIVSFTQDGGLKVALFIASLAALSLALFTMSSVVRALMSLIPVLIAVGSASIVAYVFHLKLSPMTAVGGPLVVAICTEFTSLILLRFLEERRRGYSAKDAADVAAARTGRAFVVSGMTGVAGVAVIATSKMPLLRDFGLIVAMNVVVALLSALVILPPILVWADDKRREWVSRGMIDEEILAQSREASTSSELSLN